MLNPIIFKFHDDIPTIKGKHFGLYNLRGGKERIFDDMNNGFGWSRLPKSFMAENTVFLEAACCFPSKVKHRKGKTQKAHAEPTDTEQMKMLPHS